MTQKQKDPQKAGLASYSKVTARRQNQNKGVPANLKTNNDGDTESVLSHGSAKSNSSSMRDELEILKQAHADLKQEAKRLDKKNQHLTQERESLFT